MENRKVLEDICSKVLSGSMSAAKMYAALEELSGKCTDDEDALECIIEDCLMELDMSDRRAASAKECAKMALDELSGL